MLIIDVGAETEPAAIINQLKTTTLVAAEMSADDDDDQMENEMEMNGETEEKFELENQLENDVNPNQSDSNMSNDAVIIESVPTQLDDGAVLPHQTASSGGEQVCCGENVSIHM